MYCKYFKYGKSVILQFFCVISGYIYNYEKSCVQDKTVHLQIMKTDLVCMFSGIKSVTQSNRSPRFF